MEQKQKRPTPLMYFSNHGSVLTRRMAGIEQVATCLFYFLIVSHNKCYSSDYVCWYNVIELLFWRWRQLLQWPVRCYCSMFSERNAVWTLPQHYWLRTGGGWKYSRLGYKCCYSKGKKTAVSAYNFAGCNCICNYVLSTYSASHNFLNIVVYY